MKDFYISRDFLSKLFLSASFFVLSLQGFGQATFTVTSLADTPDILIGDGNCDDGTGNCTLRAAIQEANATAVKDNIVFDISGTGVQSIQLNSSLPAISEAVVVDATTQPGYTSGNPLILIDGNAVAVYGFRLISSS